MSPDKMIEVLQAYKQGKQIQFKETGMDHWEDVCSWGPVWRFDNTIYRVKPEPREGWIISRWLESDKPNTDNCWIRVREVLDE